MTRFVLTRVVTGIALLFVLSAITFVIYASIPVEPAGFLVDLQHSKPEQIEAAHAALGLNHSLLHRYVVYVGGIAHGDLGTAWSTLAIGYDGRIHGEPVRQMVFDAAGETASVILGGMVLLVLLAVPLAIISALYPRTILDRTVVAVSLIGIATHPLVIGLVLRSIFSTHWHLLDGGYCNLFSGGAPPPQTHVVTTPAAVCQGPTQWASHLILPWVTFALFFVALYMRVLRARLLETLGSHYVRTARAKGATELRVVTRHALPTVVAPIIIMLAMDAGMAIGISIYIEVVYGINGLGRLSLDAFSGDAGYDRPMIVGIVLFIGIAIIGLNLIVDLLYPVIDPRVTVGRDNQRFVVGPAA